MANDTENKVVDRLKAEGDLIRNTGKNSLKSVRTDLAKFDLLFQSINANLIEQTQLLRTSLKIQADDFRSKKTADELARAQRTTAEKNTDATKMKPGSVKFSEEQRAGGFLTSLAGLFGIGGIGGAAGAIGGSLLRALRNPLRIALFTVIAPAIGAVLGGLTEGALLGMGSDPENAARFGKAANLAGLWGMIGLAFGRRAGVIGAAAGAAASFGDEVLDAVGLDKNRIVTIFGQEMRLETVAQGVMGALGASMATALTSPSFKSSISSFFKDAVGPDGAVMSRFARRRALMGGLIGTAVLGAYITYADDLKQWIEAQNFPEPVETAFTAGTDIAGMAATGASFGMMFGVHGALVGASIGAAVGIGMTLFNWINSRREQNEARVQAEIDEMNRILDNAEKRSSLQTLADDISTMTPEQQAEATAVLTGGEVRALNALITPIQDLTEELTYLRGEAKSFELQNQIVPSGISNRIIEVEQELINTLRQQQNELDISLRSMEDENGVGVNTPEYQEILRNFKAVGTRLAELGAQASVVINTTLAEPGSFRTGTQGFQDFGKGSFAVLHGREAVVPESTPAGQFLKNYFDENWQPALASKINQASESATTMSGNTNIVYAPTTVSPVTQVNRGGDSQVQMNSFGGGSRADLDAMARPGGVQ